MPFKKKTHCPEVQLCLLAGSEYCYFSCSIWLELCINFEFWPVVNRMSTSGE